jgi:tripartite-type tricarboxylate transporter receptor subunit TctC
MRALLALVLLLPGLAAAAEGPIRLIVPFAPGGASDTTARLVAPGIGAALGRVIVIENRGGAGGMTGADLIARAPADGNTLGISNTSPHGIVPLAQERPPYDSDRDFTHIALVAETPTVLLVPGNSRFHGFAQYLTAAQSWSRGLTYASTGIGSLQHLQGEMLARSTGARLTHVPYRGTGPALQDLISGQVDSLLTPLAGTTGALAAGQVRALAVSSAGAFAALPGVPTYAALGYPQLTATSWTGISGPRGLPSAFVERVNAAVAQVVADPEVARKLEVAGLYPPARPLPAAEYQALVAEFARAWGPVVKATGIQPN